MTNEKDKTPERIWTVGGNDGHFFTEKGNFAQVEYVRADLLTTARKEEREAAFKEAIQIVHNTQAQYKNQSSLREAVVDRLEAAASTKEKKNESYQ